jgi:hypothetical protein
MSGEVNGRFIALSVPLNPRKGPFIEEKVSQVI